MRNRELYQNRELYRLMEWGIKFRPIKSGSPHLNGKVERTQRTDLDELYSTVDMKDPDLSNLLSQWQFHYNWLRSHSSLKGRTPMQVITALSNKTPLWEEVGDIYGLGKERIRDQNYWIDCQLNK